MIQWGIIGAGNIAHRFVKGLSYSQKGKLYAVGSHTPAKLNEFANQFDDLQLYDDYMDLLNDPNVDVVYIATWHNTHYRWAKEALLRGKAVLCEKPATLQVKQMEELAKIAKENNVFFMEAMKTRFVPAVAKLKQILEDQVIGDVLRVENCFCYNIIGSSVTRYLFDQEQGGILNDVGSYNIASLLDYIHSPIKDIKVDTSFLHGVDVHDQVMITFENGQIGYLEMAMDESKEPLMTITGTKGKIECSPFYRPTNLIITLNDELRYEVHADYINDDFYTEIEEVHHCMERNQYESSRMSLQDSIDCAKVTDKIRKIIYQEVKK